MSKFKKKTVVEHLNELIEFYSEYNTQDDYLKKLIIRNLKNIKKRAEKEEKENEDTYWKGWIDKQNETMKICKMCKYKSKADKYDILISKLEADNEEDLESVKYYENAKRNCYEDSFYQKSYQSSIDKLNARREVRNEILDILEGRKTS